MLQPQEIAAFIFIIVWGLALIAPTFAPSFKLDFKSGGRS